VVRIRVLLVVSFLLLCACPVFAGGLEVLSANPQGEIRNYEQEGFDKIQILFSDAMVNTLDPGEEENGLPPFVTITPPFEGNAYWGSDRILNIAPKDRAKVPCSTRYVITVRKGAKSLSGQELMQDYTFNFTTPTLRIVAAQIMRSAEGVDSPMVIAVLFNQGHPLPVARCIIYIGNPKNNRTGYDKEHHSNSIFIHGCKI